MKIIKFNNNYYTTGVKRFSLNVEYFLPNMYYMGVNYNVKNIYLEHLKYIYEMVKYEK